MDDVSLTVQYDADPSKTLVAAFSNPGMAGVTASEYVIDRLDLEEIGHVRIDGLPAITPFANGRPYHHTRLFSREDLDVTLLTSELPVPLRATEAFGRDLLDWVLQNDVGEVTILHGMGPFGEGAFDEDIYYVASDDYHERRLAETQFAPLTGGFLDGINASLVSRAIDTPLRVGLLATPVASETLDAEGALRLVEATERLYGLGVDTAELRQFARETKQHFDQLVERLQASERTWDEAFM